MKKNYLKWYFRQTMEVNEDVADRNQDEMKAYKKTQGNWVVEIGGRMPRIGVDGDIRLRRARPTHGCRADDDDDDSSAKICTENSWWQCIGISKYKVNI